MQPKNRGEGATRLKEKKVKRRMNRMKKELFQYYDINFKISTFSGSASKCRVGILPLSVHNTGKLSNSSI